MSSQPRVCDYEGSDYRTDFWEGQGREYEDLAERIALRHLLPPTGRRLMDIGGGFGRLSAFYRGYKQVVLLDYSRSMLRQARERLGRAGNVIYVAASYYALPFAAGTFDAAMMVRAIHHAEDVPALLDQVAGVLAANGTFVLEFASKRHLKAMLRYALGRQAWSPFDPAPYEFVPLNFDFHPAWMRARLNEAGFHVKHTRTVSHFRLPLLKRLLPAPFLARLDGLLQPTGAWWQLTPSVFLQCAAGPAGGDVTEDLLFRCPTCGHEPLQPAPEALVCHGCGRRWPIQEGIYDLRASLKSQSV